jgi:hypothetical protein
LIAASLALDLVAQDIKEVVWQLSINSGLPFSSNTVVIHHTALIPPKSLHMFS